MDQVKQFGGMVGELPRRAQLAVLGIAVVTIAVLFFVLRAATSPDMVVVANSVSPDKGTQVQEALTEKGIAHELTPGGQLKVAKDQEFQARSALGEQGIALGRASHNTCQTEGSKNKYGMTSAREKALFKTCTEDALANQLEEIRGVESARVTVTLPSANLFQEEDLNPAVSIKLTTTGEFEKSQVKSMQQLAVGSVEGLKAKDVHIVDQDAQLLTGAGAGEGDEKTFKLRTEAEYNQQIETKLQTAFEEIAGAGKVKVLSNAELNLDRVRQEIRDYGGEENTQGPVSVENSKGERLKDAKGGTAGGTVGVPSNTGANTYQSRSNPSTDSTANDARHLAESQPAIDEDALETLNQAIVNRYNAETTDRAPAYLSDDTQRAYNNDVVASAVTKASGEILRNRVAVVVDDSVPQSTQNAIKNMAQAWMGGDADDSFTIEEADIVAAKENKAAEAAQRRESLLAYGKWILAGLGMIVMAFFLRRTLNDRTTELMNPSDDILMLERGSNPIPLKELEAALATSTSGENQRRQELQRKVEAIAANKPQDVAQQLRGWLHESDPYRTR